MLIPWNLLEREENQATCPAPPAFTVLLAGRKRLDRGRAGCRSVQLVQPRPLGARTALVDAPRAPPSLGAAGGEEGEGD